MLTLTTKPVVTAEEARALDEAAFTRGFIPPLALMEEASSALFYAIQEDFPRLKERFIAVIAGWGNNGGDALAVARRLYFAGYKVDLFIFSEREGSELYELQKRAVERLEIEVYDIKRFAGLARRYSVIVDGIFGVGYSYREDREMERLFERINECRAEVISIDLPSGLTGEERPSVRADHTYSIGFYKDIFYNLKSRRYAGRIRNLEISFNIEHLPRREAIYHVERITPLSLEGGDFVHKYSRGGVAAIGGSPGKLGSIVYSGLAALKSGAGICLVLTGYEAVAPMNSLTKVLVIDSLNSAPDHIDKYSAIVLGPGLEIEREEERALLKRLFAMDKQFVLDASFFTNFEPETLRLFLKPPILTPHSGEFARFFGAQAEGLGSNTARVVREMSELYHCYILLKDSFLTAGFPDRRVFIYDNPSRVAAQAGSGDILAGLIGGLASQGYHPEDALFQGVRCFYSIIEHFKATGCRSYDPDRFIELIEQHL